MAKNANDGNTNQKILPDKIETCSTFFVSIYNQIMAKREVNGNDANMAATIELRLEISEIMMIITDVIIILQRYNITANKMFYHIFSIDHSDRIAPSLITLYLKVVNCSTPTGPRACNFPVEMPISAPIPNSLPSAN